MTRPGPQPGATDGARWHRVAAAAELAEGRVRPVTVAGRRLALGRRAEGFFAVDDTCPHAGASLAEGLLDDGLLVCPLHAFGFDVTTGECAEGGPPVEVYPVRCVDGAVEVALSP